jgi:hypothetical protein
MSRIWPKKGSLVLIKFSNDVTDLNEALDVEQKIAVYAVPSGDNVDYMDFMHENLGDYIHRNEFVIFLERCEYDLGASFKNVKSFYDKVVYNDKIVCIPNFTGINYEIIL